MITLFALLMATMTASAYNLKSGTTPHGTITFKVDDDVVERADAGKTVTIVITPADGYATKDVTAEAYGTWGEAKAPAHRAPDMANVTLTKGEDDNTYTFTMPEANVSASATYTKVVQDGWISIAGESFTYNKMAKTPEVTVKDGDTELTKDTDYSLEYSNNTNAGEATVTVKGMGTYSGTATANFTINKATPQVTAPTAIPDLVYKKQAQTLINAGTTTGGTLKYSLDNETYDTALPQGTNAGNYTVYYMVEGDDNYNNVAAQNFTVAIGKALPGVTAPKAVENLAYTGKSLTLITAGSATGGTLEYSLDNNNNYGTDLPQGTDAKTYTVWYRVTGNDNYESAAAQSISVTIAKAKPVVTAPKAVEKLVYTGKAQTLITAGTTTWGTLEYSLDNNNYGTDLPQGTDAKTYTVWYRVTGNDNYESVTAQSISVTIGKAKPTVTAPKAVTGLKYTGQAQTLITDGKTNIGTMQYSLNGTTWGTALPQGTNAGEYTVQYRVTSDNTNYDNIAAASLKVSIAKINPEVTAPKPKTGLSYTGQPQALIEAGSTTGGTMEYSLDGTNYSTTVPTGTNVGVYKVYYRVKGNTNYNDVAAKTVQASIGKELPSVTPPNADQTLVYTGRLLTLLSRPATTTHGTVVYSLDGKDYSSSVPTVYDAGEYTVYYKVEGDENYATWGPESVYVRVQKAYPTILAPQPYPNLVYNGESQQLAREGWASIGSLEYSLSGKKWSTFVPEATAAGTYTVWYRIEEDPNIEQLPAKYVTCVIAGVTPTVTPPKAKTGLVYTGQPQALIEAGSTTGGTMEYSLDGKTFAAAIPTGTNAGTYQVYYRSNGNGTYDTVTGEAPVSVTIAKAVPTVTAPKAMTGLVYTSQPQALIEAGTTTGGTMEYSLNGTTFATTIPTGTNAGNYTVYYRANGNTNYETVTGQATVSVTIAKAVPTVTAPKAMTGLVYNGWPQALIEAGSTTGGTMEYSLNGTTYATTIPTRTAAGTYTVYYRSYDNENYETVAGQAPVSVTIAKAVPTVTAPKAKTGLVYTGQPQALIEAGTTTGGTMEYSLNGKTFAATIPTEAYAGTYTVYYRSYDDENYETVTGDAPISVTIAKAVPTVTAPKAIKDLVFTGEPQALIEEGSTTGGTMEYSLDGKTFTATVPTGTDAGTYTVYYRVTGNTNYEDVEALSLSVTIQENTIPINDDKVPVVTIDGENFYSLDVTVQELPYVGDISVSKAANGRLVLLDGTLRVLQGSNIHFAVKGLKKGNTIRFRFKGTITSILPVLMAKDQQASNRAGTTVLVDGQLYEVLEDCDLVLEVKTTDGPVEIYDIATNRETAITTVTDDQRALDGIYDLRGRKLDAVPRGKKGVYIINGKKTVVGQ